jgi:hypothetical protein
MIRFSRKKDGLFEKINSGLLSQLTGISLMRQFQGLEKVG